MAPEADVMEALDTLTARYYPGREDRAFLHWSLTCLMVDKDISDEDLIEHVGLDRSGDLGIDAYWIDEENGRVLLAQSKYSSGPASRISRSHAYDLRSAVTNLNDEDFVRKYGNDILQEAYPDIQAAIIGEGYTVWAALVTNRRIPKSVRDYALGGGSEPWTFLAIWY
jgi:hypothetical protein